ncbi:AAA family ATPase [Romboutsia sp. 1001216sp1]|uniref:AAA family ATPase n=1 Tax=unclassified Romboutsia TaxID=2626894 RepID=UPI0018A883C0|nr:MULTISPECIES: AAA family ATPase [unclassified Romboutsia]MDB8792605.1 AAA family ATPase [Romboutsia sp. 1001216sp1]MDB8796228.1 AAA family ATPase [Romboutsia sp. 1001216sp1]MDB8798221.1 AAA family ATPase [Romboutsia sp. 1001216sp1]
MSTTSYKSMLNQVIDKIHNLNLTHENSIIVGDNSSGKSEILKSLVNLSFKRYYLIDAINRTFDSSKITNNDSKSKRDYKNISKRRVEEDIFNLNDSFDLYSDGMGHVEGIFFEYLDELKILLRKFLEVDIDVEEVKYGVFSSKEKIIINGEIENLSNGYQAIIRLFLEIIYLDKNKGSNEITLVIDEVDEYLSSKNKSRIVEFLKNEFQHFNWIFTTHSAEVIASSKNFNLIILKGNNYEYLDSNDFNTITDVQEIFRNLYNKNIDEGKSDVNTTLRRLLSLKISDKWSEQEEKDLEEIENKNLTNSQLLLLHQIKNW